MVVGPGLNVIITVPSTLHTQYCRVSPWAQYNMVGLALYMLQMYCACKTTLAYIEPSLTLPYVVALVFPSSKCLSRQL